MSEESDSNGDEDEASDLDDSEQDDEEGEAGEDDEGTQSENTYDDEDDSADDASDKGKKKKPKKKEIVIKEVPADPYLIRREATLLTLVLKSFKKRVIVFFNEKVQCHRMLVLFKIFGLKAAEVQGNLT